MKRPELIALAAFLLVSLSAEGQGSFYVSFNNSTVQVLHEDNTFTRFSTLSGIYNYAMAVGPNGDLYTSDCLQRIYRYDQYGNGALFANDGHNSGPTALDFGPDGYLYAADYLDSTIRRYDKYGNESIFARYPTVVIPWGMAVDPYGSVYVANRNGSIYRFDPSGQSSLFATFGPYEVTGLLTDSHGNLFVANTGLNAIYRFDQNGNRTLFARTDPAPARMEFDPQGNLYVTFQPPTHMIERFDPFGNRTLSLDTSRFGYAIDISFIPEPSAPTFAFLGLLCWLWQIRSRPRAS